jgi:hypothetical protein
MENNKKSFILHLDSLCILDDMSLEQKGILFDAIYKYQLGIEVDLDFGMKMAFAPFRNQFIRDNDKYIEFSKKQSENGKKGGRPKKQNEQQENPKNPSLFEKPKKAYNDSVSDSDSVKVNDNESDNEKKNKDLVEIENFDVVEVDFNYNHCQVLKFESPSWLESVSMQQKITIEEIQNKIDEFELFLRTTTTTHKNKKDFINHFINWLTKKNQIEKDQKAPAKKLFRFDYQSAAESFHKNRPDLISKND